MDNQKKDFQFYCENGDLENVKILLKNLDYNNQKISKAIFYALESDDLDLFILLLPYCKKSKNLLFTLTITAIGFNLINFIPPLMEYDFDIEKNNNYIIKVCFDKKNYDFIDLLFKYQKVQNSIKKIPIDSFFYQ